jgi:hypothetical protein
MNPKRWLFLPAGILALACMLTNPATPTNTPRPAKASNTPEPAAETVPPVAEASPTEQAEPPASSENPSTSPPEESVRLIFIHHSCGENWLADGNGGLAVALMQNNYFVSDTNYGWGPEDPLLGGPIGDNTDTGNWWNWFLGPSRNAILQALYAESDPHAEYSRLADNPGGENRIVMFKSCFPNSALGGSPDDPPTDGGNPLQGQSSGSEYQTVANAKRIYLDLLQYFSSQPEKLFIAVTAPPLLAANTTPEQAANTRAFNLWLVNEWLSDYPLPNAAVFDFYNVLTSNGGDPETNDLDSDGGNHHRCRNDAVEYITDQGGDTSAYALEGDDHPTAAGNSKATAEFVPLLNYYYHRWADSR